MNPLTDYWKTYDGRVMSVFDMAPTHLLNAAELIDRRVTTLVERMCDLIDQAKLMRELAATELFSSYGSGVALTRSRYAIKRAYSPVMRNWKIAQRSASNAERS